MSMEDDVKKDGGSGNPEHPEEKKEYSEKYLNFTGQYEQKLCMEKTRAILADAYEEGKNKVLQ